MGFLRPRQPIEDLLEMLVHAFLEDSLEKTQPNN